MQSRQTAIRRKEAIVLLLSLEAILLDFCNHLRRRKAFNLEQVRAVAIKKSIRGVVSSRNRYSRRSGLFSHAYLGRVAIEFAR
jgi:hypothetical protein